jgi:hypothetical protein
MEARAIRAVVGGAVQGVGFRDASVRRARAAGALGWIRNRDDGRVEVHAEGAAGRERRDSTSFGRLALLAFGNRRLLGADANAAPLREQQHSSDARFGTRLQTSVPVGPARSRFVQSVSGEDVRGGGVSEVL